MKDRDILIELLAIKLYEHGGYLESPAIYSSWSQIGEEERNSYRSKVRLSSDPESMYE